ncbi:putative autotransporter adhesin-like protein [Maribacter polysiphoniae]|nr:putative autotransporter adhesin-like protein [Maribacter polysiphoniae]
MDRCRTQTIEMKNCITLIVLLVCFQTFAQRKPKIKGNKNVIEVQEELPFFNAIKLVDDLELVLQKGPNNAYTINADDNLIDVLKFKVADSTLVIGSFYKITSKKKLDIVVTYTDLETISMIDGKVNMKDVISSDRFTVNLDGPSRLELNATAPIMTVNMKGMSSGDFNLASDSLHISLKDRVDARIYAVGMSNTIWMSENASASMEGNADVLNVKLKGNSNLKAERMEATSVVADMKGSPNVKIKALEEFKLASRGSSKTQLYGDPKIIIEAFLDTSQLLKEN